MAKDLEAEVSRNAIAIARASRTISRPSLADFAESTVNFKLHDWQRNHLCPLLERCRTEKGLRIAIHKPPQFGGSILVSQRFPADLLGGDPNHRIGLACYNETHAAGFGSVVKSIIMSPQFQDVYGDLGVKYDAPAAKFFTAERQKRADGQPSFLAMGLLSGFTGRSCDTLIVDDPYASADDAISEAVNERVWRWWAQTAGVRIAEEANVVVMFHRYHEDDFAGRLLASGRFEYIRFPAIADDNEDGSDPTGRAAGELLSPMRSSEWLRQQQDSDPKTFLGQFQGKPRPDEGAFFQRQWLKTIHDEPAIEAPRLGLWVRAWDLATTAKSTGDFTAGALVGMDSDLTIHIRDMIRLRGEWPEVQDTILETTARDSLMAQREGFDYQVGMDARATQQGFVQDFARNAAFSRIPLWPDKAKGDKKQRASGWATRARLGKLRLIPGDWDMQAFIKECLVFDGLGLSHDDQVDAVSTAYALLWHLMGGHFEEPKPLPWDSVEFIDLITGESDDEDDWR